MSMVTNWLRRNGTFAEPRLRLRSLPLTLCHAATTCTPTASRLTAIRHCTAQAPASILRPPVRFRALRPHLADPAPRRGRPVLRGAAAPTHRARQRLPRRDERPLGSDVVTLPNPGT